MSEVRNDDKEVKQRSAKEAMAIVMADRRRFEYVEDAWNELTEDQQYELIVIAQSMAARNV